MGRRRVVHCFGRLQGLRHVRGLERQTQPDRHRQRYEILVDHRLGRCYFRQTRSRNCRLSLTGPHRDYRPRHIPRDQIRLRWRLHRTHVELVGQSLRHQNDHRFRVIPRQQNHPWLPIVRVSFRFPVVCCSDL